MEAIKFYWEKGDTFESIHERILKLTGKEVLSKKGKIFIIGDVSQIYATSIEPFFPAGQKRRDMWAFSTEYYITDKYGNTRKTRYNLMIPRSDIENYHLDKAQIIIDPNHEFIHYNL